MVTIEQVLDEASKQLISKFNELFHVDLTSDQRMAYVSEVQKTIKLGGINPGRMPDQRHVMYGLDVKAVTLSDSDLDILNTAFFHASTDQYNIDFEIKIETPVYLDGDNNFIEPSLKVIQLWNGDSEYGSPELSNILIENLAQYSVIDSTTADINPEKAKEILKDRTIYELLQQQDTLEDRIKNFWAEFGTLTGNPPPDFDTDGDGYVDNDWYDEKANLWYQDNDLTGQENYWEIGNDEDFHIPRLARDTVPGIPSIEGLRDSLNPFLRDVDESRAPGVFDDRPGYKNVSSGYLEIRNLNQAIIIRNQESDDVGLIGSDPNNPIWQTNGFTITMWVKFLDKVSGGTLFNFGNPLRASDPYGFMLETFVAKKTSNTTFDVPGYYENIVMADPPGTEENDENEPGWIFSESDTERFIRLVVRDGGGNIRDSHIGGHFDLKDIPYLPRIQRYPTTTEPALENNVDKLWNYTRVPVDLQEWYFIVATYSPWDGMNGINEDGSFDVAHDTCNNNDCDEDPDFWRWNINASGYTSNSGLGAQCKVEIISKTDLLRARGYST